MNTLSTWAIACVALAAAACTANIKDPKVDQGGQDNSVQCTEDCEDVRVTCEADCNDDGCRVSCVKDRDDCKLVCEGG